MICIVCENQNNPNCPCHNRSVSDPPKRDKKPTMKEIFILKKDKSTKKYK